MLNHVKHSSQTSASLVGPVNTLAVQLDISYQAIDDGAIDVTAKLSNPEAGHFKFGGSSL